MRDRDLRDGNGGGGVSEGDGDVSEGDGGVSESDDAAAWPWVFFLTCPLPLNDPSWPIIMSDQEG